MSTSLDHFEGLEAQYSRNRGRRQVHRALALWCLSGGVLPRLAPDFPPILLIVAATMAAVAFILAVQGFEVALEGSGRGAIGLLLAMLFSVALMAFSWGLVPTVAAVSFSASVVLLVTIPPDWRVTVGLLLCAAVSFFAPLGPFAAALGTLSEYWVQLPVSVLAAVILLLSPLSAPGETA